ncbi:CU044_5270 family protein [Saccharothrix algeriensis]|uniref:CU044_5270 family protein n=1 Tax=Saccharothrix algeriensis TaxID=173560 RepID=A0A8T8I792_9PSEU|nr:CU044_5270 family protein [Saccharothrix algeriensis]MBM7812223.1 hypothetical protein [Saccharothrix algeriensis]QTR05844.1 CU044_5270 family protein [Saccharothrix algeriensis]
MSDDNILRIWTDDELDAALDALNADTRTDERVIAGARVALIAATGEQGETEVTTTREARRRRSGWRWLAGAAAVAVLVAGGQVVQTVSFGRNPAPAGAEAVATLDRAATSSIGVLDEEVGPGQYRYVATRAWWMASAHGGEGRDFARLAENVLETWAPANPRDEWLLRRDVTGNQRWVVGTEEQARAAGVSTDGGWPEGEWRAPCGDFYARSPEQWCTDRGSWQNPTPEWQAGLPTDPDALFERLAADAPGDSDAELLVYAADALRSGLVRKDVRANIYKALAKLPGLQVTEQQANLDGRTGTALGVDDGKERQDIIIDPETGQFIGERQVAGADMDLFKAGTVLAFTSVTTGVVDTIGAKPAG